MDNCRVMQFGPPTPGRSLAGHVIRRLLVDSETACEANCFDDDDCMSVNLGPKNQGMHLCELSSSDDNLHPEGLKERSKFIFKSVWVSVVIVYWVASVTLACNARNQLPLAIRQSNSVDSFKTALKTYLFRESSFLQL